MNFTQIPNPTKAILITQSVAMLMGASTHLIWVVQNGFLSDKYNAPLLSSVFWDSLTFLDPLAAILLIAKPIKGLYLTLVIITLDIIHNNVYYFDEFYMSGIGVGEWVLRYWMILGQLIFALFVYLTLKRNLKVLRFN